MGAHQIVEAEYHPRNCMHAKQNHLDLKLPPNHPLTQLAKVKGTKLECINEPDNCVKLIEQTTGIEIKICIEGMKTSCEKNHAYIMVTRKRKTYLGGIYLETASN